MKRKRKFGVWLNNRTDSRDDEWVYVWAKNAAEAKRIAEFDEVRFSLGDVAPVAKFRKIFGLGNL